MNQNFNVFLDNTIKKVVIFCFSDPLRTKILKEYSTESRVMALWLLNTTLLALTTCNPRIPTIIGIPLGFISISPTIKSLYMNHKLHIKTCREELSSKQRYELAKGLALIIGLQILTLYFDKGISFKASMAGNFILINTAAWVSIVMNSITLDGNRKITKMNGMLKIECELFASKIEILKERVEELDQFINEQPELLNLIRKKLEKEWWLTKDLDPIDFTFDDSIIDKRTKLSIELSRREYYFNKRINFIKSNTDVYDLFCECNDKTNTLNIELNPSNFS